MTRTFEDLRNKSEIAMKMIFGLYDRLNSLSSSKHWFNLGEKLIKSLEKGVLDEKAIVNELEKALEHGYFKRNSEMKEINRLIKWIKNLKRSTPSPEQLKQLGSYLRDLYNMKIKAEVVEFRTGNKHLREIPLHPDPDKFYVMVKELNHYLGLKQKHPVNLDQKRFLEQLTSSELLQLARKGIKGSRFFGRHDMLFYPGSNIKLEAGHHRLYEIYQRYLKGEIKGNTLIEFEKS